MGLLLVTVSAGIAQRITSVSPIRGARLAPVVSLVPHADSVFVVYHGGAVAVFDSALIYSRTMHELKNLVVVEAFKHKEDLFFRTIDNRILVRRIDGAWQRFNLGDCKVFLDGERKPFILSSVGIVKLEKEQGEWVVRQVQYSAPYSSEVADFAIMNDTVLTALKAPGSPIQYYAGSVLIDTSAYTFTSAPSFIVLPNNSIGIFDGYFLHVPTVSGKLARDWKALTIDGENIVLWYICRPFDATNRLYFTRKISSILYELYYVDSTLTPIQAPAELQALMDSSVSFYGNETEFYSAHKDYRVTRVTDSGATQASSLMPADFYEANRRVQWTDSIFSSLCYIANGSQSREEATLAIISGESINYPLGRANSQYPTVGKLLNYFVSTPNANTILGTDKEILFNSKAMNQWSTIYSFGSKFSSAAIHQPGAGLFIVGGTAFVTDDNEKSWRSVFLKGVKFPALGAVVASNRIFIRDNFFLYYVDLPLKSDTAVATELPLPKQVYPPNYLGMPDGKIALVGINEVDAGLNSGKPVKSLYTHHVNSETLQSDFITTELLPKAYSPSLFDLSGSIGIMRGPEQAFQKIDHGQASSLQIVSADSLSSMNEVGISAIHALDDSTFVVASDQANIQYTVSLKKDIASSVDAVDQNIIHYYINQLYPNPAATKVTLRFGRHNTADPNTTELLLIDLIGKVVRNFTDNINTNIPAGTLQTAQLDIGDVAGGNYILVLRNKGISDVRMLSVQK